jgi:hypothetical protein
VRQSPCAGFCAAVAIGVLALGGCGSDSPSKDNPKETDAGEFEKAADEGVCTSEAKPLDQPYGTGFPADWPFPPDTVVYNFEDRGDSGSIVTAISSAKFADILDFMNGDVVDAGFEIESGETEEHDAEAEWRGSDFHGRWAIRESGACPGETIIQILAGEN